MRIRSEVGSWIKNGCQAVHLVEAALEEGKMTSGELCGKGSVIRVMTIEKSSRRNRCCHILERECMKNFLVKSMEFWINIYK